MCCVSFCSHFHVTSFFTCSDDAWRLDLNDVPGALSDAKSAWKLTLDVKRAESSEVDV